MKIQYARAKSGCFMRPATSQQWSLVRRHSRSRLINGRLVSCHAAGSMAMAREVRKSVECIKDIGRSDVLNTIELLIGRAALESMIQRIAEKECDGWEGEE